MIRTSSFLVLLLTLTLSTGCNVGNIVKTEKDELLFNKIYELQYLIEQDEWDDSLASIIDFEKKYAQRKWKLQLLGVQSDYQDIELEVELLKENLRDEDEVESLIRLRQIYYRLNVIYNM